MRELANWPEPLCVGVPMLVAPMKNLGGGGTPPKGEQDLIFLCSESANFLRLLALMSFLNSETLVRLRLMELLMTQIFDSAGEC